MVRTIRLYGPLAERYGSEHRFKADNFTELLAGLRLHCPGFHTFIRQFSFLTILKSDGRELIGVPQDEYPLNFGTSYDTLHLNVSTTAAGAETFASYVASTYFAGSTLAYAVAYIVYAVAISYVLGQIVQSMQDTTTTEDTKSSNKSSLFNGPENRVRQGARVQLNYGRFLAGSVTINHSMSAVRQHITIADTVGAYVNETVTYNIFANDLYKENPQVTSWTPAGGPTKTPGQTHTFGSASVTVAANGDVTLVAGGSATSLTVAISATDFGIAHTQNIDQTLVLNVADYPVDYTQLGGPGGGDTGASPGDGSGSGNGGDAAGDGTASA